MIRCDFGMRPEANQYESRWIVVTGIRDIHPADETLVVDRMIRVTLSSPEGVIFGGARGVDTVALRAARRTKTEVGIVGPRLVAIVPGTVAQQPKEAREAIQQCADEIIELHLNLKKKSAFFERNRRMITEARLRDSREAPICVAFPSDLLNGGTRSCMADAMRAAVTVEEYVVRRSIGGSD